MPENEKPPSDVQPEAKPDPVDPASARRSRPSDVQPEAKPDPVDPAKEAAKKEAIAFELEAQKVLESGGRNAGPIMMKAADAWKKAGESAQAAVASKVGEKYIAEDAPKKKEKEPA